MASKREVPLPPPFEGTSTLPYLSLLPCGDSKYKVVAGLIRNGVLVEHEALTPALGSDFAAFQLRRLVGQMVFRPAIQGKFDGAL